MLVVFAVDIPLLLGFSVARFQDPHGRAGARGADAVAADLKSANRVLSVQARAADSL
jgi:hypothetical protein